MRQRRKSKQKALRCHCSLLPRSKLKLQLLRFPGLSQFVPLYSQTFSDKRKCYRLRRQIHLCFVSKSRKTISLKLIVDLDKWGKSNTQKEGQWQSDGVWEAADWGTWWKKAPSWEPINNSGQILSGKDLRSSWPWTYKHIGRDNWFRAVDGCQISCHYMTSLEAQEKLSSFLYKFKRMLEYGPQY